MTRGEPRVSVSRDEHEAVPSAVTMRPEVPVGSAFAEVLPCRHDEHELKRMEDKPQRHEEADREDDASGGENEPQFPAPCSGLPEPITRHENQPAEEDEQNPHA